MPDKDELKQAWRWNLSTHKLTVEGTRKIEALRSAAKAMADAIIELSPAGRDQALALTSLEQMSFHMNAAVARTMNEDVNRLKLQNPKDTPKEDQSTNKINKSAEAPKES